MVSAADLVVSADFGTSGVKVGVVDRNMNIVASHTEAYPLDLPAPGYAEQNPEDWWAALQRAVLMLAKTVENLSQRTAALSFCGQMAGVICADPTGRPLRPCLIWLDKRSADITHQLVGGPVTIRGYNPVKMAQWLYLANGAPSLTGMDPPGKMLWIRENEPDVWDKTHKLLDPKDWLVHRATGQFVTTPDSANLTWMMDSRDRRQCWSERLCSLVGIPSDRLPEIVDGTTIAGGLTDASAVELGLSAGTPVVAGSGDVFASALGSRAVADGALHVCVGTSCWIGGFFPSRRLSATEGYATISAAAESRPLLIASQETAGACINWIRNVLCDDTAEAPNHISALIEQALKVQDGVPPLFLPWMTGERVPADESRLRGGFLGLSLMDTRQTMLRGVLEGIALNTRWAFQSVYRQKGVDRSVPISLVGGVFASESWCQLLSDCLQVPMTVQSQPQLAGVRGAAMIAATGLKWVDSPWSAAQLDAGQNTTLIEPDRRRADYFDTRFDAFLYAYRRTLPWFRRADPPDVLSKVPQSPANQEPDHD